jgi:hypothetical protein
VRDRDRRAQDHGVARASARADEVRRDHRLPVAGRQRVQRSPAERAEEQQHEHPVARRRVLEQTRETVGPDLTG